MKFIFIFCILCTACSNQPDCLPPSFNSGNLQTGLNGASAKRAAPKPVTPVVIDSIGFFAPDSLMSFVEARNTKTGAMLWKKQIYNISYDSASEQDVQDVFIDSMVVKCNFLFIHNEKNEIYRLDLQTLLTTKL